MIDFVWRQVGTVFITSPSPAMLKRNWLLAFLLVVLFGSEFFLPVKGQAQSFSDTGLFYFTGTHQPRRSSIFFREFLEGPGIGSGLKAGPVRLHPFLGVAEVYTDNVFRRNTNRKSDFLTTIAPGLQAFMPFGGGKHSVLLDYRAGIFRYNKFSQNNALAQDALGHVSLNYPGGLTVDLQGGRVEGFDPRGSEVDTQQTDITKWNLNHVISQVEFLGETLGFRLRSTFQDLNYTNNGQSAPRNRTRADANLSLFVSVTPTTRALLGVRIVNYDYDTNKQLNSFGYGVFTGFRLAPTRRLTGEFNIGYQILNYDHAPKEVTKAGAPPGPPTEGDILRSNGLSAGSDKQTSLYMQGRLIWDPTSRLNIYLSPFSSIQQSAVQGTSSFRSTGFYVNARQMFTDRLGLRGNIYYANDNFNTNRTDDRFRFRIGPEYRAVKWLGFRLDYIFEKRSSNDSEFDYNSNTIMLSIQGIL